MSGEHRWLGEVFKQITMGMNPKHHQEAFYCALRASDLFFSACPDAKPKVGPGWPCIQYTRLMDDKALLQMLSDVEEYLRLNKFNGSAVELANAQRALDGRPDRTIGSSVRASKVQLRIVGVTA